MTLSLSSVFHPYSRYGLAIALLYAKTESEGLTESNAPEILAQAIDAGLEHFRLRTTDNPEIVDFLRFTYIKADELKSNRSLVYSKGLSTRGIYLKEAHKSGSDAPSC
jgi:hypothetical protein